MDPDHKQYDSPESHEDTQSKGAMYLVGGIVVVVLLMLIATGKVQIWG